MAPVAGDLVRQVDALSRIAHLSEPQMGRAIGQGAEPVDLDFGDSFTLRCCSIVISSRFIAIPRAARP